MRKKLYLLAFIFWGMIFSTQASANAGIPMIAMIEPILFMTFIPIVLIESWIITRCVANLSFKKVISPVILSNVFSTIIGIPLAWGLLYGVQLLSGGTFAYNVSEPWNFLLSVTVQSPVPLPWGDLDTVIPLAAMFLFIPFFYVSVLSERYINRKLLKDYDGAMINRATFKAHLGSYGFLYLIPLWDLIGVQFFGWSPIIGQYILWLQ